MGMIEGGGSSAIVYFIELSFETEIDCLARSRSITVRLTQFNEIFFAHTVELD
jgi:hypothetical protein